MCLVAIFSFPVSGDVLVILERASDAAVAVETAKQYMAKRQGSALAARA